ncbi:MAG: PDZ domain-containing protein, partial [Clostridiales bacterium]|nr:PDZ domain-containing protein [Clostridiales bacterium]
MRKNRVATILSVVLMTAVVTFAITFMVFNERIEALEEKQAAFDKLTEINEYIDRQYIIEYDYNESADAMAWALMRSLPDGWSYYYTAEQYDYIMNEQYAEYAGIGATCVQDENGYIQIVDVFVDSPAMKAGLRYGDTITAVDGIPVSELGYEGTISRVKGKEGTDVVLTVYSYGSDTPKEVTITRGIVHDTNLTFEMMDDEIGYIMIKHFDEGVQDSFAEVLTSLVNSGAKGFIFDVRMNGGGYMHVMADMLNRLMGEGTIIGTRDRFGVSETLISDAYKLDMPMVVVVHEYSYSAAEFFAAVLQETEGVPLVGMPTVGKGYAQHVYKLSDGSAIGISVNEYFLPSGKSLKDGGVTPDYEVSLTPEQLGSLRLLARDEDPQLVKAINVLREEM